MSKGSLGAFAGAAIGFVISGGNPLGAQLGCLLGPAVMAEEGQEEPPSEDEA